MSAGSSLASRLIGTRAATGGAQTMNSLTLTYSLNSPPPGPQPHLPLSPQIPKRSNELGAWNARKTVISLMKAGVGGGGQHPPGHQSRLGPQEEGFGGVPSPSLAQASKALPPAHGRPSGAAPLNKCSGKRLGFSGRGQTTGFRPTACSGIQRDRVGWSLDLRTGQSAPWGTWDHSTVSCPW